MRGDRGIAGSVRARATGTIDTRRSMAAPGFLRGPLANALRTFLQDSGPDGSWACEDENTVGREDAAHAVHERHARAAHLPFARFAAKLDDRFDELAHAARARGMAVREQSAVRIDRQAAAGTERALGKAPSRLVRRDQAQV